MEFWEKYFRSPVEKSLDKKRKADEYYYSHTPEYCANLVGNGFRNCFGYRNETLSKTIVNRGKEGKCEVEIPIRFYDHNICYERFHYDETFRKETLSALQNKVIPKKGNGIKVDIMKEHGVYSVKLNWCPSQNEPTQ